MSIRLKVNDTVKIISGKDKGKQGKVIQILPKMEKVVVDGVNKMYRHIRSGKQGEKGQRVEFFGPIHISNVKLAKGETAGRVGFTGVGKDKKRVIKKAGKTTEI